MTFFYALLVSGSHWFGVCLARDIQKNWIFCETTSASVSYEPLVCGSHLFSVCSVPASPEVYRKIGIFWEMTWYFFYGPLYMAVTCSVLVCLRSACVLATTVDTFSGQSTGRFGKHFTRVTREVGPRIDSTREVWMI